MTAGARFWALAACAALPAAARGELAFETPAGSAAGTRIRWNVPFKADLSACDGFEFDFKCSSLSDVGRGFTAYVFSGEKGCYCTRIQAGRPGEWSHVVVRKHDSYNTEKSPQGWGDVRRVAISAVKGSTNALSGAVRDIRPLPPPRDAVAVLYCEKPQDASRPSFPADKKRKYALDRAGVPAYLLSDRDVLRRGIPPNTKIVLAEDGKEPPADIRKALEEFRLGGGRIACWNEIAELAKTSVPLAVADGVAMPPAQAGELRSLSCGDPFGSYGPLAGWEETAAFAEKCGFDMVTATFCRGVRGAYESGVLLKWAPPGGNWRDSLEEAKKACARHGLKLSARRCCFSTPWGATTKEEISSRRKEGRFAVGMDGKPAYSDCPTHPENIRIETEAIAELARKGVYSVDLDYIRYYGENLCFCARCRGLFEKRLGRAVDGWPAAVRKDPALAAAWEEFRCANIERVVQTACERVHRESPGVKMFMSAFSSPAVARKTVGQDWPLWCRRGWIDSVWMMDYCHGEAEFEALVGEQRKLDVGKAMLYPLVGPVLWPDAGDDAVRTLRHIAILREAGYAGFGIFTLDARTAGFLPALRDALR